MTKYNSLNFINAVETNLRNPQKIHEFANHPNVLMRTAIASHPRAPYLYPNLFLVNTNGKLNGWLVEDWFVLRMAANRNPGLSEHMLNRVKEINKADAVHDPLSPLVSEAELSYDEKDIRDMAKHPNVYVVEGIAKNTTAAEIAPDLFLKKRLFRQTSGFLVSDWHILRSAALGNAGLNGEILDWAYTFDQNDKEHYVHDTEAYAKLVANPKTPTETLNKLIKNDQDYNVINIASMANQIRSTPEHKNIAIEIFRHMGDGAFYQETDYKLGAERLVWVLSGAPYDKPFLDFLNKNTPKTLSLNDIASGCFLDEYPDYNKYSQTIKRNLEILRPGLVK